ncbi:hypothetical protein GCM10009646_35040 [Streptomyces aureus]
MDVKPDHLSLRGSVSDMPLTQTYYSGPRGRGSRSLRAANETSAPRAGNGKAAAVTTLTNGGKPTPW